MDVAQTGNHLTPWYCCGNVRLSTWLYGIVKEMCRVYLCEASLNKCLVISEGLSSVMEYTGALTMWKRKACATFVTCKWYRIVTQTTNWIKPTFGAYYKAGMCWLCAKVARDWILTWAPFLQHHRCHVNVLWEGNQDQPPKWHAKGNVSYFVSSGVHLWKATAQISPLWLYFVV